MRGNDELMEASPTPTSTLSAGPRHSPESDTSKSSGKSSNRRLWAPLFDDAVVLLCGGRDEGESGCCCWW